MKKRWFIYLLRCADKSIYCGITVDPERRLLQHNNGTASKYTRARRPISMIGYIGHFTRSDALKIEFNIKKKRASEKEQALAEWGKNK